MNVFTIELSSPSYCERIENVVGFTGRDDSGSFSILARRAPLAATLAYGLCSFRTADRQRHFLAVAGGVLLFRDSILHLAAHYVQRDDNAQSIIQRLTDETNAERESVKATREALRHLEHELLRKVLTERASAP